MPEYKQCSIRVLVWCSVKEELLGDLSFRCYLCQLHTEEPEYSLASTLLV